MSDILFGSTIGILKNAMNGASETHGAIANNIANVNTPNFHRTDVSFKDSLALLVDPKNTPGELPMNLSNSAHMNPNGQSSTQAFEINKSVNDTTQIRVDGSNVDIDQEMAKLSLNSSYAQTMGELLQNQYTQLRKSIAEQV